MDTGTGQSIIRIRPIAGGTLVSNPGCALLLAGALLAGLALRLGLPGPYGWGMGWWAAAVTAALVAPAPARAWLVRRNLTLIAGPGYLTRVDWLGRHRTFHRHEIAAVLRESVVYGRQPPMPHVFVIGAGNRRLLLLWPWMWDERELEEVWRRAGIEPEGRFEDVETAAQLAARLPGLIPAWWADTMLVPVVATILIIAFLLFLFSGIPGYGEP